MNNKNKFLVLSFAVAFTYFAFGAITNIAGAIVPKIRETYEVSSSLSILLAATFFIAYGLTSIPWGIFMEKTGKKITLITSALFMTLGVLVFAAIPGFIPNTIAMFICGFGITGIQVALNPLVGDISDPEKYSRNLTLFMVLNGVGGYSAPQLVTLIKNLGYDWTFNYWVFTGISILVVLTLALPKYPEGSKAQGKSSESGSGKNLTFELLTKHPLIYLYALGIFLYVGVEVGVANTIGFYLQDKLDIASTLGEAAEAAKNTAISNYWGGLLIGRLLGTFVLSKIPGGKAIMIYISLAAASLFLAMSGDINQALIAFPAVGFFISIMFPTIYGSATNSFAKEYSGSVSAVLCTAIIGGAAIGPAIAWLAEITQGSNPVPNWDMGLSIAFACYAYLFVVGLVSNKKN